VIFVLIPLFLLIILTGFGLLVLIFFPDCGDKYEIDP